MDADGNQIARHRKKQRQDDQREKDANADHNAAFGDGERVMKRLRHLTFL